MKNCKIGRMVAMAILMALVVVMQMLGGIIPPVGGFSISLVLIPIVLGAAAYGIGAGALLGATFGVIVFINCVTGVDPGGQMVLQANPVLCFFVVMGKGILSGVAAGFMYSVGRKINGYVGMLAAAIICPMINTGVFVLCMSVFYVDVLAVWAGGSNIVGYVLTGLILMNFVPELLINIIFSPAAQRILNVIKK